MFLLCSIPRGIFAYLLSSLLSVSSCACRHQISKKKLERVTVQGGDFGKAGQRTNGEITVSGLRKLLEDDVEDLAKRALSAEVGAAYGRTATNHTRRGGRNMYLAYCHVIRTGLRTVGSAKCTPGSYSKQTLHTLLYSVCSLLFFSVHVRWKPWISVH